MSTEIRSEQTSNPSAPTSSRTHSDTYSSDLFSISPDRKSVQVWLWNRDKWQYDAGSVLDFDKLVHNVIPADFNGDGRLDLLVMTAEEDKWWGKADKSLNLTVVLGAEGGFGDRWELDSAGRHQPFVFDDEHNLLPSLLGYLPNGERDNNLRSWKNVDGSKPKVGRPSLFPIDSGCTLAHPHSSAYVDMDGDCAPDLVLHCQSAKANSRKLQVYENRGTEGYVVANVIDLPQYSRAVTFADMNRDGAIDLVFATCKRHMPSSGLGEECSINIAYNQQARVCSGESSQYEKDGRLRCRGWGELCQSDPNWGFDFSEKKGTFVSIPLEELFPKQKVQLLLSVPGPQNGHIPLPLRPGDFDVDGFPGLLATVKTEKGTQIKILKNVPCGKGVAGCQGQPKGSRGLIVAEGKGYEALEAITDAEGASWIDLDDDGSLDIMVQRTGKQKGSKAHVTFIQNNFYHDAFFLKAQVLNGACDRDCVPADGGKKYSALGASYSGATFKFTVWDTAGKRHAQQVPQLPQTAHHALYSPHTYIGLGRTNNYIEVSLHAVASADDRISSWAHRSSRQATRTTSSRSSQTRRSSSIRHGRSVLAQT